MEHQSAVKDQYYNKIETPCEYHGAFSFAGSRLKKQFA